MKEKQVEEGEKRQYNTIKAGHPVLLIVLYMDL